MDMNLFDNKAKKNDLIFLFLLYLSSLYSMFDVKSKEDKTKRAKFCQLLLLLLLHRILVRVFANGLGNLGSIPGQVMPKTFKKWYLMSPCLTLSIIRYRSRVKWSNPGKRVAPSPTPIERGGFGSPSTTVANFTYLLLLPPPPLPVLSSFFFFHFYLVWNCNSQRIRNFWIRLKFLLCVTV